MDNVAVKVAVFGVPRKQACRHQALHSFLGLLHRVRGFRSVVRGRGRGPGVGRWGWDGVGVLLVLGAVVDDLVVEVLMVVVDVETVIDEVSCRVVVTEVGKTEEIEVDSKVVAEEVGNGEEVEVKIAVVVVDAVLKDMVVDVVMGVDTSQVSLSRPSRSYPFSSKYMVKLFLVERKRGRSSFYFKASQVRVIPV
ncbi:hypothetical protein BC829DRAFT_404408 [Chytridium lagenaria]|nr:hypothetical protein BC829DRAFT_404408 [Chytridium lagenaria]